MQPNLAMPATVPALGLPGGRPQRKDLVADPLVFSGMLMVTPKGGLTAAPAKATDEPSTTGTPSAAALTGQVLQKSNETGGESQSAPMPSGTKPDAGGKAVVESQPVSPDAPETAIPLAKKADTPLLASQGLPTKKIPIAESDSGSSLSPVTLKVPAEVPVEPPSEAPPLVKGPVAAVNIEGAPINLIEGEILLSDHASKPVLLDETAATPTQVVMGMAAPRPVGAPQASQAATDAPATTQNAVPIGDTSPTAPAGVPEAAVNGPVLVTMPEDPAVKLIVPQKETGAPVIPETPVVDGAEDKPPVTHPEPSQPLSVEKVMALKTRRLLQDIVQNGNKAAGYAKPTAMKLNPQKLADLGQATALPGDADLAVQQVAAKDAPVVAIPEGNLLKPEENLLKEAGPQAKQDAPEVLPAEGKVTTVTSSPQPTEPTASDEPAKQPVPQTPVHAQPQAYGPIAHSVPGGAPEAQTEAPVPGTPDHALSPAQDKTGAPAAVRTAKASVQAPIFRQVVQNLDMNASGDRVQIQLHPEALGKVEVSLVSKGHYLEVRIVADNPEAATALKDNLQDLTKGLHDKASRFHHLDVHVEIRGDEARFKPESHDNQRRDPGRDQNRQEARDNKEQPREGNRESREDRRQQTKAASRWWWPNKEDS